MPIALSLSLLACKAEPANPQFNDAAVAALADFEAEDPVELAYAVRQLEASLLTLDLEGGLLDRSTEPARLSEGDLVSFAQRPDRDPAACLPVSVAHRSAHPVAGHVEVQLLEDQTPIEPASSEHYERFIIEGADCFAERGCEFLRTENPLTKDNAVMTLSYTLYKDLRWVDLGLPDPAEVPEGEQAENTGDARWALVGRSWIAEPAVAEDGASIVQSYSLELWLPEEEGSLRMMALWSETLFEGPGYPEDVVAGTTRSGIQGIFDAADEWLDQP